MVVKLSLVEERVTVGAHDREEESLGVVTRTGAEFSICLAERFGQQSFQDEQSMIQNTVWRVLSLRHSKRSMKRVRTDDEIKVGRVVFKVREISLTGHS